MSYTVALVSAALAAGYFGILRLKRYLQYLQQEEYNDRRFAEWICRNKIVDTRGTTTALSAALALLILGAIGVPYWLTGIVAAAVLAARVHQEPDPTCEGKIRLKMTDRAVRIHRTAAASYLAALAVVTLVFLLAEPPGAPIAYWLLLIVVFQATPCFLMLAVRLLQPGEDARQAAFLEEAKAKFRAVNPYVIGITGSYGKTSTKAVLGSILDVALGHTFWPAKGINTPMGITREIRERLTPAHKFAVIEMGAYAPGSIRRLCELTPPHAGIITAIGLMHLERMGGAENVFRAKSELAQALPDDGILVCNGDDPGASRVAAEFPKQTTLRYGIDAVEGTLQNAADVRMSGVRFAIEGSYFTIHWKEKAFPGFTPLHGTPALSNVLAGFSMACALGADPELVLAAVRNLKPVDNRLEVRHEPGYVQINDAYNSNPVGFRAALEVLRALPGERRILVTPGMIELGDAQARENEAVALEAARICDLVFVVGSENREALTRGLAAGGMPEERVRTFERRDAALTELAAVRLPGDIVLLENDLPDVYEVDFRI